MNSDRFKVLSGNANPALARAICRELGVELAGATIKTFSDGEIWVQITENVRGADVFVIQPTCPPADRHLMELILMIDALKRASADRITAVMPYYGYARQDRKDRPRVPISAKVIASMLERAGAHRLLTLDLHAAQIQGFFDIPVDHLFSAPVMIDYVKRHFDLSRLIVVSPDAGGVERARAFAKRLDAPLAIIDKRRERPNESDVMNIIGDVRNLDCLLVDDLIDTAGTLGKSSAALLEAGASSVTACATHPILSGSAIENIERSALRAVIVSDSIPLREEARGCARIRVLSVAPLLARAIQSIHEATSVSSLFV